MQIFHQNKDGSKVNVLFELFRNLNCNQKCERNKITFSFQVKIQKWHLWKKIFWIKEVSSNMKESYNQWQYFCSLLCFRGEFTVYNVSKYGVFPSPYFPAFGLNTERYEVIQWFWFAISKMGLDLYYIVNINYI